MTTLNRILPLLLLPLLSGCLVSKTSSHAALDAEAVGAIEPGTTTAQEVLDLLGAPNEVVQLGKRSAFRYDHSIQKQSGLFLIIIALRGVDTQQDRAWIFFDEQGVVSHAGATFEAEQAEYDVPFGG